SLLNAGPDDRFEMFVLNTSTSKITLDSYRMRDLDDRFILLWSAEDISDADIVEVNKRLVAAELFNGLTINELGSYGFMLNSADRLFRMVEEGPNQYGVYNASKMDSFFAAFERALKLPANAFMSIIKPSQDDPQRLWGRILSVIHLHANKEDVTSLYRQIFGGDPAPAKPDARGISYERPISAGVLLTDLFGNGDIATPESTALAIYLSRLSLFDPWQSFMTRAVERKPIFSAMVGLTSDMSSSPGFNL